MQIYKPFLLLAPLMMVTFNLGCLGGSSGGSSSSESSSYEISGRVSLGPVNQGTVTAYEVSPNGQRLSTLGTATTDANGAYSLSIPKGITVYELELTGGSYSEEAGGTIVTLGDRKIRAFVNNTGPRQSSLTPLTEIAASRTLKLIATGAEVSSAANVAAQEIGQASGIPDIFATQPCPLLMVPVILRRQNNMPFT